MPEGEIEAAVIDQLRAVFRQPEIVAGTWKAARAHIDDISEADARAALQQLDSLWEELFPAEQARIVALLVERVDIGTNGLNLRLRMDEREGIAPSYMTRVLRLTLLAPDIVEAILEGAQGPEVTLARVLEPMTVEWSEQPSNLLARRP